MGVAAYLTRCFIMFLVTWTSVRIIGKKSISNMTPYDLAALMLITTVAAEPLVYKIPSKASMGVLVLTLLTILLGSLSLKKFFYNIDSKPLIVIADGQIQAQALKSARMNIPLLMSELRIVGYQNIADVKYAIVEPSGKLSVIPTSQSRPVQPSDMSIGTSPVFLGFPLIIEGKINKENLNFLQKDPKWLMAQLQNFSITNLEDVLYAQMDGQGQLHVINKNNQVKTPNIF